MKTYLLSKLLLPLLILDMLLLLPKSEDFGVEENIPDSPRPGLFRESDSFAELNGL